METEGRKLESPATLPAFGDQIDKKRSADAARAQFQVRGDREKYHWKMDLRRCGTAKKVENAGKFARHKNFAFPKPEKRTLPRFRVVIQWRRGLFPNRFSPICFRPARSSTRFKPQIATCLACIYSSKALWLLHAIRIFVEHRGGQLDWKSCCFSLPMDEKGGGGGENYHGSRKSWRSESTCKISCPRADLELVSRQVGKKKDKKMEREVIGES